MLTVAARDLAAAEVLLRCTISLTGRVPEHVVTNAAALVERGFLRVPPIGLPRPGGCSSARAARLPRSCRAGSGCAGPVKQGANTTRHGLAARPHANVEEPSRGARVAARGLWSSPRREWAVDPAARPRRDRPAASPAGAVAEDLGWVASSSNGESQPGLAGPGCDSAGPDPARAQSRLPRHPA